MAGNIRDSNYYRQRAAEIRARGGNEQLARTMQNYADLYDAGIYNDNSAPVRFGGTPQPSQPTKKSSSGGKKQKIADAPSKYVGSAAIAAQYAQRPEYDADPYRTNYEPSPLGTADFNRLNDTNTGSVNGVLPQQRYNHGGGGGDYGTSRKPTYVSPGAEIWKKARQGYPQTRYPAPVSTSYNGDPEGVDYTPNYPWERQLTEMNNAIDQRYNHGGGGGDYEFELPPMEVTADAPKQGGNSPKKFQLVGTKPGGGSALTEFYANQLRYVPYENNKGVNGVKYGSSGLVNRMRDLCQIVPYNETDGTNCARTVSAALDGTPYSGMYNVDQIIETAARNGQLRDAYGSYKPKAGDLAVTNEGNHVVMVTENGGVIQNGQSKNGVYETNKKPWEQKGGVQFYVTTSDYSDLFPSFHFGTGLKSDDIFGGR